MRLYRLLLVHKRADQRIAWINCDTHNTPYKTHIALLQLVSQDELHNEKSSKWPLPGEKRYHSTFGNLVSWGR